MANEAEYIVGLDLGAAHQFTALAVLERPPTPKGTEPINAVRHLHRFPLGTPYTEIVAQASKLMSEPALAKATAPTPV